MQGCSCRQATVDGNKEEEFMGLCLEAVSFVAAFLVSSLFLQLLGKVSIFSSTSSLLPSLFPGPPSLSLAEAVEGISWIDPNGL